MRSRQHTSPGEGELGRGSWALVRSGEGGPGGEWGSTLGADTGAELLEADGADSGQTDPVRAASRRVAVVTGEGTVAARRERLVRGVLRRWDWEVGLQCWSGWSRGIRRCEHPPRGTKCGPPTVSRLTPRAPWSSTFPQAWPGGLMGSVAAPNGMSGAPWLCSPLVSGPPAQQHQLLKDLARNAGSG